MKAGYNIECVMLYRGADRDVAKEMVLRAGIASSMYWKPHLSRDELYREILDSDVVVNMFAHGGAGGISFEAMALGRPVMQYANPTYFDLMYGGSMPPFINCRTEQEIYEKIVWCCETDELNELAEEGVKWVWQHIDPEKALTTFLFYYSLLTGEKRLDFGPHIPDMQAHVEKVLTGAYDPFVSLSG